MLGYCSSPETFLLIVNWMGRDMVVKRKRGTRTGDKKGDGGGGREGQGDNHTTVNMSLRKGIFTKIP